MHKTTGYQLHKNHVTQLQSVTISLPVYLRTWAKEQTISLSATLRNVLEDAYKQENGRVSATNHNPTISQKPHTLNTEAVSDLEDLKSYWRVWA